MLGKLFHESVDISPIFAPIEALSKERALAAHFDLALRKDLNNDLFAERGHIHRRRRSKNVTFDFRIPTHAR